MEIAIALEEPPALVALSVPPRVALRFAEEPTGRHRDALRAQLEFSYGGWTVAGECGYYGWKVAGLLADLKELREGARETAILDDWDGLNPLSFSIIDRAGPDVRVAGEWGLEFSEVDVRDPTLRPDTDAPFRAQFQGLAIAPSELDKLIGGLEQLIQHTGVSTEVRLIG